MPTKQTYSLSSADYHKKGVDEKVHKLLQIIAILNLNFSFLIILIHFFFRSEKSNRIRGSEFTLLSCPHLFVRLFQIFLGCCIEFILISYDENSSKNFFVVKCVMWRIRITKFGYNMTFTIVINSNMIIYQMIRTWTTFH